MKTIIEDGYKTPLKVFAQWAVLYLELHPACDEVVQQSSNIIELEHNNMTSPSLIFELPEGYEYNLQEATIGIKRTPVIF